MLAIFAHEKQEFRMSIRT
jgi:hypothetical protein